MTRVDAMAGQSTDARWLTALRVTATLSAALVLLQGLTAGRLISGEDALSLHGGGAIAVHVVAALQVVAAFLLWRSSRGPVWPLVVSGLALVLGFVQAALGEAGNMKAHVPVALALTLTVATVLAWAWYGRSPK